MANKYSLMLKSKRDNQIKLQKEIERLEKKLKGEEKNIFWKEIFSSKTALWCLIDHIQYGKLPLNSDPFSVVNSSDILYELRLDDIVEVRKVFDRCDFISIFDGKMIQIEDVEVKFFDSMISIATKNHKKLVDIINQENINVSLDMQYGQIKEKERDIKQIKQLLNLFDGVKNKKISKNL